MNFAGIVFYNHLCSESKNIECLKTYGYNVIIFDNSDDKYIVLRNKEYAMNHGLIYLGDGANHGLSFAYRQIVSCAINNGDIERDWISIFDDDSIVKETYYKRVQEICINDKDRKIYLPIVKIQDGTIVSPSRITLLKDFKIFRKVSDVLAYTGKKMTGINSGMLIKLAVFKTVNYYEKLFIDHIDHEFISRAKENGIQIKPFEGELLHNLSEYSKAGLISTKKRFSIYLNDSNEYYSQFEYIYHVLRRTLKYTLLHGKIDFIKMALGH